MLERLLESWLRKSKASKLKTARKNRPLPRHNFKVLITSYSKKGRKNRKKRSLWEIFLEDNGLNYFLAFSYILMLIAVIFSPDPLFRSPRWLPVLDMNRDGTFSITDLFYWCFWLYYLPGDVVLSVLLQFDFVARFFEIYSETYGGLGSLVMSSLFWWTLGGANMLIIGLSPIVIQTFLRH